MLSRNPTAAQCPGTRIRYAAYTPRSARRQSSRNATIIPSRREGWPIRSSRGCRTSRRTAAGRWKRSWSMNEARWPAGLLRALFPPPGQGIPEGVVLRVQDDVEQPSFGTLDISHILVAFPIHEGTDKQDAVVP